MIDKKWTELKILKYFSLDYLDINVSDLSAEEQEEKHKQWDKACEEYNDYITENEGLFSKAFLKEYRNGGFHDYRILQIKSEFTESGALNVAVELAHKGYRYLLISKDVVRSSFSIDNQDKSILSGNYLYGEYYKDKNGFWNHNFMLGCRECDITAKKFVFKKQKENNSSIS